MLQAAIIFLREGFEAFLIVAIMLAYLRKTGQHKLIPAVYWAIVASIVASGALGFVLFRATNQAIWEAVSGLFAIVLVTSLVIHMWRTAPRLKQDIEDRLTNVSARPSWTAFAGVFLFASLMITREGMETALLLVQIHESGFILGTASGIVAAAGLSWLWARYGHRINLQRFFQATSIFLLLFVAQLSIYTFHEFTETGLIRNVETWHEATEPFSPVGIYGKWFSLLLVIVCAAWFVTGWAIDWTRNKQRLVGRSRPQTLFR